MSDTIEQTRIEMQRVFDESELLHGREEVEAAMERMAAGIAARLGERNPLVLSVMSGAMIFAGQLLTRLVFPLEVDYIHASRYRGETSGGELHWRVTPRYPLAGRSVLVLDDILDEGYTLAAILDYCREQGAAEVLSGVLVEKLHDRKAPGAHADFVGLQVVDRYLFGYGMDYREYWRNAPGIYAVKGL